MLSGQLQLTPVPECSEGPATPHPADVEQSGLDNELEGSLANAHTDAPDASSIAPQSPAHVIRRPSSGHKPPNVGFHFGQGPRRDNARTPYPLSRIAPHETNEISRTSSSPRHQRGQMHPSRTTNQSKAKSSTNNAGERPEHNVAQGDEIETRTPKDIHWKAKATMPAQRHQHSQARYPVPQLSIPRSVEQIIAGMEGYSGSRSSVGTVLQSKAKLPKETVIPPLQIPAEERQEVTGNAINILPVGVGATSTENLTKPKSSPNVPANSRSTVEPEPEDSTHKAARDTATQDRRLQLASTTHSLTRPVHSINPLQQFDLHGVSDRSGQVKVTKPGNKSKKQSDESIPAESSKSMSIASLWGALQVAIDQEKQREMAAAEERCMELKNELASSRVSEASKQGRLDAVEKENSSLSSQLEGAEKKIAAYDKKVQDLCKFSDGLGVDLSNIRQYSRSVSNKCRELELEVATAKEESTQLRECIAMSNQGRDAVSKACMAVKDDFQKLGSRHQELQKEIDEKSSLLETERKRFTALQGELQMSIDSQEGRFREFFQGQFSHIEDKLEQSDQSSKTRLEELAETVKGLADKEVPCPSDIKALDETLQGLSQRIMGHFTAQSDASTASASFRSQLGQQIHELKDMLLSYQQTFEKHLELEAQNAELTQQMGLIKESLRAETQKTVELEEKENVLTGQLEKSRQDVESAKAEARRTAEEAAEETYSRIRHEYECLNNEKLAKTNIELENETKKLTSAVGALQKARNELATLKIELDASQQSSQAAASSALREETLQQQIRILTEQVKVKDIEMRRLQADASKAAEEQSRRAANEIQEKANILKATTEARTAAEIDLSKYRLQSESYLKEQEKNKRQIESLYAQLAETDKQKVAAEDRLQEAMKNAEQAIKDSSDKHKIDMWEMQRRLKEAENERDAAMDKFEHVKQMAADDFELLEKEAARPAEQGRNPKLAFEGSFDHIRRGIGHIDHKIGNQEQTRPYTTVVGNKAPQSVNDMHLHPSQSGTCESHANTDFRNLFNTFEEGRSQTFEVPRHAGNGTNAVASNKDKFTALSIMQESSSPLSEPISFASDSFKENLPNQTPPSCLQEEESRVLRELNQNATTPIRLERTCVPAEDRSNDISSELSQTKPLDNPFEIYHSPSAELARPGHTRATANTTSKMIHMSSHPVGPQTSRPVSHGSQRSAKVPGTPRNASLNQRSEPMRRSLIGNSDALHDHQPSMVSKQSSSTPDYLKEAPGSTNRMPTYGHHLASRPNSQAEQVVRAPSMARPSSGTVGLTAHGLPHSSSKNLKRRAAMDPPPSRRDSDKRLRAGHSMQSLGSSQSQVTIPSMGQPSQAHSNQGANSAMASRTASRTTRSRVSTARSTTARKPSNRGRRPTTRYNDRFSQA